jgi:hypothetical protein
MVAASYSFACQLFAKAWHLLLRGEKIVFNSIVVPMLTQLGTAGTGKRMVRQFQYHPAVGQNKFAC